jgi:4-hydroxybenzoate polyprenyltransferase
MLNLHDDTKILDRSVSLAQEDSLPLFVDLDGTLIKSDLLLESFCALLKHNPFYLFLAFIWLLHGKAYLKQQIAVRVHLDASLLPYHAGFLDYLQAEAATGRQLFLATAANNILARQVADHLGIFHGVLASDRCSNLSGKQKLHAILAECREGQFDYAGNGAVDLPILSCARNAILVNPTERVKKATQQTAQLQRIFAEPRAGLVPYLKALRVHQWLKNLLLFVPLFTAHEWSNLTLVLHAFLGWFAFSQCASSVYLLNDLLDLPADRNHPRKRTRPLAAGDIPLLYGGVLMILLLFMGLSTAVGLSWRFLGLVLLYLICNLAYSLRLKTMVLIDVLILAGLYTLRIIAGAAAIEATPSFWLLAFSVFVFLSLALVKRCSELHSCLKMSQKETRGRDYHVSDLDYLHSMGTASGYLAVLVLALYVNSPELAESYSHPEILWVLCLTTLYWISRVWLKAGRGEMHDDPLVFTIKDRGSQLVLIANITAVLLAL